MKRSRNARRARIVSVMALIAALAATLGAAATLSAAPPLLGADALVGPPAPEMARFGQAVAAREGMVAVGAPTEGDAGNEPGAVALVEVARDARGALVHTLLQVLRSPQRAPLGGDHFGTSVALGRGVVAVGADAASVGDTGGDPGFEGAVELFREFGGSPRWVHQATLRAPQGQSGAEFGCAIAIADDLLVVGARREDAGALVDAGRVHLFRRAGPLSTWEWVQSLESPEGRLSGWFGAAVATAGPLVAIGAPGEGSGAGAVHLYARGANGRFSLLGTLCSPRPAPSAWFGAALAIDGSTLVVGEPRCSVDGTRPGAAWMFHLAVPARDPVQLVPAVGSNGMAFGQSVAIDSERVLVGAPGFDAAAEDCGRAYLFDRAGPGPRTAAFMLLAAPSESTMGLCGSCAALLRVPAIGTRRSVPAAVLGHLFIEEESPGPSPGVALYELPARGSAPAAEAPQADSLSRRGTTCPACSSTGPPSRRR